MNEEFTVSSFIAELVLMHAKGKRIELNEVEKLIDRGMLLEKIEELGFNNYEFIDGTSKDEHFNVLKPIISEMVLLKNKATTMGMKEDCGLLYLAFCMLNKLTIYH